MLAPDPGNTRGSPRAERLAAAAANAACVAVIVVLLALFALYLYGMRATAINGASMGKAVPLGSVAFFQLVPATELRNGDVIGIRRLGEAPVVHRIVDVRFREGVLIATLRGDANPSDDPEPVVLSDTVPRLAFSLPWVAYAAQFVTSLVGVLLLIGVPLLIQVVRAWMRISGYARGPSGFEGPRLVRAVRLWLTLKAIESRRSLSFLR